MEWNINKNSKSCLSCEKDFKENDVFISAIYETNDKDKSFVRRDYCLLCWEESDKDPVFSFWKFRVQQAQTSQPKNIINTDMILDLFLKLNEEEEDNSRANLRYVLALFLIRKKILKLQSSLEEESNLLNLFYPKDNQTIKLYYPEMTEEEINNITEEIKTMLSTSNFILN